MKNNNRVRLYKLAMDLSGLQDQLKYIQDQIEKISIDNLSEQKIEKIANQAIEESTNE